MMKTQFYLLFFLSCFFTEIAQAQITFQRNVVIDETYGIYKPLKTILIDVDNDGLKDLYTTGIYSLVYFKNLGNEQYSKPIELLYDESGDLMQSELIDIDGDGILDLVYNNGNLYWKKGLNSTTLTFGSPLLLENNVYQFSFADIDADGDLDLFSLRYATMQNSYAGWRENQGNGNFTTFHNVYNSLQRPDKYALGHLNSDNLIDIVHYKRENDHLEKKMNTGGYFNFQTIIDNSAFQSFQEMYFLIDDVDKDGDNDILFYYTNGNTKKIIWYNNSNGNGDFTRPSTLVNLNHSNLTSNLENIDFSFVDIDGDHLKDLIFLNSTDKKIWWKKNLGNLQFSDDLIIDQNAGRNVTRFSMGDVNEDGNLDLILTSINDDRVAIYYNNGDLTFSNPKELSTLALGSKNIIIDDIDQDNIKDILVAGYTDGKLSWFKNGNGSFTDKQKIIKPSLQHLSHFMYIDLDGDGDKDILYGYNDSHAFIRWFENLGNGNFNLTEKTITSVAGTTLSALTSGDFDGDGDMDVFLKTDNAPIRLFLNNGSGNFTESNQTFSNTNSFISGLDPMIDLDGDGEKDIYFGSGNITWYKKINGSFVLQPIIASDVDNKGKHVLDFDGDGDLDIVFYKSSHSEVGWLENTGNMQFTKHVISTPRFPFDAVPIDVDQDGNLDIVWGNRTSLNWQQNDGNQNFSEPILIDQNIGLTSSIIAADINGDHIPEIIYSTSSYGNYGNRNDHISIYNISPRMSTTDISAEKNIKIYPNPVTDVLNIQSKSEINLVEVYSMNGQKVTETKENYIHTASLKPGIYMIKILAIDGKQQSYQFIKK